MIRQTFPLYGIDQIVKQLFPTFVEFSGSY